MLQIGDRATGVPANPRILRKYPTVTGTYTKTEVSKDVITPFTTEYVVVGDGQSIDCSSVRPASRREKDTAKVVV